MRFTGARILRDGILQERSIAIAGGRITKGPLPAIDLSGYVILPGIIDMMAARPAARGRIGGPGWFLDEADRIGAAAGVTTQFMHQGWSWETGADSPAAAEAMAQARAEQAARFATDLRLMLRIEHGLAHQTARILELVRRSGIDLVMFSNRAARARDLRDGDEAGFSGAAARIGQDAGALSQVLDALAATAASVPRALCDLAEQFDELGLPYGSIGDESGEAREHHSMIGAGICMAPASSRAAAAARAVCDPVVLSARDLAEQIQTRTLDAVQLARCDAIVSDGAPLQLAELALQLEAAGVMDLPRAWALISENPAQLMRLTGRGRLDLGARADLAILNRASGKIEVTIAGGRMAFLGGAAAARILGRDGRRLMAAE
ncbi:amidohydrolase family protein [Mangrovicoccus algicola]|uniref:alkylphosphonate utilization protein n=1 Tax=Mangrovicoccus algicola TaxID=2771008 RepID=UPI001866F3D4|nr:alkylphosphonate utilization protein [Mangrovicoccus algicola]